MIGRAAVLAACVLLLARGAAAHPAPFSYLDLVITDQGVTGSLVLHDLDVAHDFGISAPEQLRDPAVLARYFEPLTRLMSSRLSLQFDGARVPISWGGIEPLLERESVRLTFRAGDAQPGRVEVDAVLFPYDPIHQTFVNVYEDGELRHQAILSEPQPGMDYYAGTWQGRTAVFAVFVPAGIEHIVIGPDHVLFLIGLLLLGGSLWRLTTIVTAFTLGHSVTLSLAALDVLSPPAALVEPIIALSIVFVGADNLLVQRDVKSGADAGKKPRDIRPWIAGVFGLVHGFGFASVLQEFGLPLTALGWSLLSFNIGVEIGQLAIVIAVAAALRTLRQRNPTLAQRLVVAGSLVVIAAGGYWFVERVFLAPGA